MNPWAIVITLIVWAASLAGVGSWQNYAGHTAERVAWQEKEGKELRLANMTIITLENEVRDKELRHAQELSVIAVNFEKERKNVQDKTDARIADLRNGKFRLRDPGATPIHPFANPASQVASSACQCDGASGGGLSAEAAEFLLRLTGDADITTKQLGDCQAVIMADRAD